MSDFQRKPEKEQRTRQSLRMLRLIQVHKMTKKGQNRSLENVREIAKSLGVSERTIYRHLQTLDIVYSETGRSFDK